MPARPARRSASAAASVVPPRMRTRMTALSTNRRGLSRAALARALARRSSASARTAAPGSRRRRSPRSTAREFVFGGERHLALAAPLSAEAVPWPQPVRATPTGRSSPAAAGASACSRPAIRSTYGVGAELARLVAADEMACFPQASAFSLAAARLGWSLPECACVSLHGRAARSGSCPHLQPGARILALSWDGTTPARLAALLERARLRRLRHRRCSKRWAARASACGGRAADAFDLTAIDPLNLGRDRRSRRARRADRHPGARPRRRLVRERRPAHQGGDPRPHPRAPWRRGPANCSGTSARARARSASSGCCAIRRNRAVAVEAQRRARRRASRATPLARRAGPRRRRRARRRKRLPACPARTRSSSAAASREPGVFEAAWAALRPGGRLVANAVTLETEQRPRAGFTRARRRACGASRSPASSPSGGLHGWRPAMPVTQWVAVSHDRRGHRLPARRDGAGDRRPRRAARSRHAGLAPRELAGARDPREHGPAKPAFATPPSGSAVPALRACRDEVAAAARRVPAHRARPASLALHGVGSVAEAAALAGAGRRRPADPAAHRLGRASPARWPKGGRAMTVHFIGAGPGAAGPHHGARPRARSRAARSASMRARSSRRRCSPGARRARASSTPRPSTSTRSSRNAPAPMPPGRTWRACIPATSRSGARVGEQLAPARGPRHPLHADARRAGLRRRRRGARARADAAGGGAIRRADPHLRPRLGDAGRRRRSRPSRRRGATLAIHLSIHAIERVVAELLPAYGADCPARWSCARPGRTSACCEGRSRRSPSGPRASASSARR